MKKAKFIFLSSILFLGTFCFAQEEKNVLAQSADEVQEEISVEENNVLATEETVSLQDESNSEKSTEYLAAESAIEAAGRFFKVDELLPYTQNLNLDEKNELYSEFRKNPPLAGLLNGLVGFGIGSFTQSDWIGGTAFLVWDSASVALMLGGCIGILNLEKQSANTTEEAAANVLTAIFIYPIVIVSGAASFFIGRGVAAGVGVGVSNSYNKKLQNALSLSKTEISFVPVVSQNYDSGLALRIKF